MIENPSSWTWRVAEPEVSKRLRLLYEPGNWGDILKGSWLLAIAAWRHGGAFRYGDPFCGAASYPRTEGAQRRLQDVSWAELARAQMEHAAETEILGGAGLLWKMFPKAELRIYDNDGERKATWEGVARVDFLDATCGWRILREGRLLGCDLVFVDPYDLDKAERWTEAISAISTLVSSGSDVLGYLFNRSPRGPQRLRGYEAFRKRARRALEMEPLVGRIPADPLLSRSWHETLFFPAHDRPIEPGLLAKLGEMTRRLARPLLDRTIFPEPDA